jgi:hypothetical protein
LIYEKKTVGFTPAGVNFAIQFTVVKKFVILMVFMVLLAGSNAYSQCSICTKTAQQLGEKPAKGLNAGILYLAFAPLVIGGFIGWRWWRSNKSS